MSRRLLLATGVLLLSLVVQVWRAGVEPVFLRQPLEKFPHRLGDWSLTNEGFFSQAVLNVLRADDYLSRTYFKAGARPADLFIAYYRSQQAGETMHSPKNCLPGAGWVPTRNDLVPLGTDGEGSLLWVNRYVVQNGAGRALLVLYWYQANGRVLASEYWGKFYLVWDAMRAGRSDGAILRITVPLDVQEEPEVATEQAMELARMMMPHLPDFLPE